MNKNKTNIIVIQCLYCPDKYQLERNFRSLESLKYLEAPSFDQEEYRVEIYLYGYVKEKLQHKHQKMVQSLEDKIHAIIYLRYLDNLGKANVINNIIKSRINTFFVDQYLLYLDSDIIIYIFQI